MKSILTGFGMKLGAEIARMMSDRMQSHLDSKESQEDKEESEEQAPEDNLAEAIPPHLPVMPLPSGDTGCEG